MKKKKRRVKKPYRWGEFGKGLLLGFVVTVLVTCSIVSFGFASILMDIAFVLAPIIITLIGFFVIKKSKEWFHGYLILAVLWFVFYIGSIAWIYYVLPKLLKV